MIRIKFLAPVGNEKWDAWIVAAKAETDDLLKLVDEKKPWKIKDALYKRMRDVIFTAYFGKCGYCEAKIKADQPGDVEHYRPKRAVSDENWKVAMVADGQGGVKKHPGYYWLAYDWTNLLPSCAKCNRPTKVGNVRVGKGDRFPVMKGWASSAAEVAVEKPLFLHPVLDNPARHLTFDPATGVLGWKTRRGKACVELLGLNRDGLIEERQFVYDAAESLVIAALSDVQSGNMDDARRRIERMEEFRTGRRAYSMAGRKALRDKAPQLRQLREAFGG